MNLKRKMERQREKKSASKRKRKILDRVKVCLRALSTCVNPRH
jgi:hypothetical protein